MSNPAEGYESYMVPALFAPWASRLVQLASPRRGERVLDLACGTGVVARQLAPRVGTVTGLDLNPNMLAVARAAGERERLAIDWREGRAEALPFADGAFDLVVCQFALMFMADRRAALREANRVLARGGRLALSVWQGIERHPFYRELDRVIQQRLGVSALAEIFAIGDAGELRALLEGAGFQRVEIESPSMTARFPNPAGFLAGEIDVDTAAIPSMQHLDDAGRRAMTEAISGDMQAALRAVTEGDHVVIPFHAHLARAERG
jgi:ubiquinone/menaquinone biosynthesis C-methylase UbiE